MSENFETASNHSEQSGDSMPENFETASTDSEQSDDSMSEDVTNISHKVLESVLSELKHSDVDTYFRRVRRKNKKELYENENATDYTVISSVICAHLKFFLSTIIQHMAFYKKKHVFYCDMLNGKKDPRMLCSGKSYSPVSSLTVYENTKFTAKDFFQLLKDHEDLIPKRSYYHLYINRLLSMDSVQMPDDDEDDSSKKGVKKLPEDLKRLLQS